MSAITLQKKPASVAVRKQKSEIGLHIGCVSDWSSESQACLVEALEACIQAGFKISILAKGDDVLLEKFLSFHDQYGKSFTLLEDNEKNREQILSGSHVLLIPHKASKSELTLIRNHQLVPLTVPQKGLSTFLPVKEEGNAFLFREGDAWDFFRCAVRAAENKQFGYDWSHLKKSVGQIEL